MQIDTLILKKIVIFFIILFATATGFAEENPSIGKVVALRGKILAIDADFKQRDLVINAPVFLNDTIKTLQGRIQLMFNDNTLITLGSNTDMKLTKYSWKPEDKNSAMETRIEEGSFRIMGGAITRTAPENFKTHTPSGTIGIRGSMYAGLVKGMILSVIFQGGKGISIKNDMGLVTITEPGFGTNVNGPAQAPEEPKKMTPEELLVFETEISSNPENNPSDSSPAEQASDPSEAQPESSETGPGDTAESVSEPTSATADTLTETNSLISDPESDRAIPEMSLTNEISEVTQTAVDSAQTTLNTSLTPTGTKQEIKSILLDLGYSGLFAQSSSIPSTGIWSYAGKMKNMLTNETPENMKFIVNWDNGRIIALEDILTSININSGFGFGNVDSSGTISGIRVLGSDYSGSGTIRTMTGNETFGHFYGAGQSGLGLAMEGYDINLQNSTDQIFWKDIAAAVINNKSTNSYSGAETWKGFFTGTAEDIASSYANRRIFCNNSANDFTLTIDKDNGTFTGALSGEDFLDSANNITGLTIGGGAGDSVYISDKTLGASLSGASVITINGNDGGLKSHGNFMITSDAASLSLYTTWGYWEAAYSEPVTEKNYHIHIPGALWIAGNQTPASDVTGLIGTYFVGTYTGKAEGVMFTNSSQMTRMTDGTTNLIINFAPGASFPVSGAISFNEVNLPVTSSTDVFPSGFFASVSGAVTSSVNGTFYGPNAQAAAGNFSVDMPDGKQYHGIFAGNR